MEVQRIHRMVCLAAILGGVWVGSASSQVHFDTAPTVACRPVDDDTFRLENPSERLWEAKFSVSTFVSEPQSTEMLELAYLVRTLSSDVSVYDYSPRTTLGSGYAGNIAHEQKAESSRALGVTIAGIQGCLLNASGSGDIASKETTTNRFELLAPHEALIASGTLLRGHAVYFKLRHAPQVSLEGSKELTIIFRTPATWRAAAISVHCQALRRRKNIWPLPDEPTTAGSSNFVVGLYAAGDEVAKAAAEDVADKDIQLRRALRRYRDTRGSRLDSSLLQQLVGWADRGVTQPSVVDIDALTREAIPAAAARLREAPEELRTPAREFLAARQRLESLRRMDPAASTASR